MRVALIGVSHWHTGFFIDPLLEMDQVGICGISDSDPLVVSRYRERLSCDGSADYRDLCRKLKPDFVVALGRHCEMAEEARFLINEGIPFAIEKPAGMNADEVADIARLAETKGAFAAVPLVLRGGGFLRHLMPILDREEASYATFRFIAGSASRYIDNHCPWMLDPAQSGGGCTINLGVHFFDIARMILGTSLKVSSSLMSNHAWNHPIEDYSAVTLREGTRSVLIETGYLYPAPTNFFDMHYAVRTARHYLTAWGPWSLEIRAYDGPVETHEVCNTNVPLYRDFMIDVLARLSSGKTPLANLADMRDIMHLVDDAYALAAPLASRNSTAGSRSFPVEPR